MSYQEKENVVNIISAIVVAIILWSAIYQRQMDGQFDLTQDYRAWGVIFLIYMGFSIVARIIIYVIFAIINAIATREDRKPVVDERIKLIKLLGTRNSHFVFSSGFVLAIIGLALGMPLFWIFILFVISGLLSEIIDNGTQLYFHRRGL